MLSTASASRAWPCFGVIAWSLGKFTTIMPTLACHVGALVELDLDERLDPIAIRAIPTLSRRFRPTDPWSPRRMRL